MRLRRLAVHAAQKLKGKFKLKALKIFDERVILTGSSYTLSYYVSRIINWFAYFDRGT